ncbi:hypothetical protein EON65_13540 [archaeon]|nr:MAG: hypothetical protein EON65_13540 [archaeon]
MIRIKKEATVDIAFVVDCTGSIIKHMVTIKTNIKEYVAKVQALHSMAQIRLAFIGYRDYGCKAQQILVLDFTVDLEAFAKMVS